ncbi:hypothetical protein NA56DRAFT_680271 [Hyaloscypha hepaticicola]|uniref:Uncharacterized protein n=1 Tax=Hyaloscypha hepaticicola TaxID=2082293 RepID=A0A2J6PZ79_9HELO|nr:hypothetical protein NA56DRAFT_680271 [Hyaloscypha hepaticicola]
MSADLPSSNPFRRKGPPITTSTAPESPTPTVNHIAYLQADVQPDSTDLENIDAPKKITKKVRVQSPPPLSPSIPDSTSTIGEETYSISAKPPTPVPRDDDPFDSTTSDTSEDEVVQRPSKAPANPFSKTLEMMEHPERGGQAAGPTNTTSSGRASMDVEAFKRLLMTGDSGLGTPTGHSAPHTQVTHALGGDGSSTDTSSVSRQSIFEPVQEPHPESPRTSHEISEPEDERRRLTTEFYSSTLGRKAPPPPSSRHGKLIKVELRDDPQIVQSPPTPGSITSPTYFNSSPRSMTDPNRSQTDLNKPLPPAPRRASHDSEDPESIFDREAAGKTPEPPSPSSSIRKKTAPAPPITRRHSQLVHKSNQIHNDAGRLSPKVEEETNTPTKKENRPRSDSARAPPPPPVRRPTVRGFSHHGQLTSPSTVSLPAPPPSRGTSRAGRPPSVLSMDLSNEKRASMAPPPPPPRHGRRISTDAQSPGQSRRTSGEQPRRSIESARRGSASSSIREDESLGSNVGRPDIMADLSALQREIDALRIQSEKERVT